MAYLFYGDGGDGGSAVPFVCSQSSLLLFLCFCARCSFSLFVFPCFLNPCDEALRTVLASPFEFGSGFCVVFSLFFFLCIFFLCFAGFFPSVLLGFFPLFCSLFLPVLLRFSPPPRGRLCSAFIEPAAVLGGNGCPPPK